MERYEPHRRGRLLFLLPVTDYHRRLRIMGGQLLCELGGKIRALDHDYGKVAGLVKGFLERADPDDLAPFREKPEEEGIEIPYKKIASEFLLHYLSALLRDLSPLMPQALLKPLTNPESSSNNSSLFSPCFSIIRTIALPTITASAYPAILDTCSGEDIPNPTPTGSLVERQNNRKA